MGDPHQLQPICEHTSGRRPESGAEPEEEELTGCDLCHIGNSPFYQRATPHRLTISVRHEEDPGMAAFLDEVRTGVLPTDERIEEVLGDLVRDEAECAAFMEDPVARSIHTHLVEMHAANDAQLIARFAPEQIVTIEPTHNLAELRKAGVVVTPEMVAWAEDAIRFHQLGRVAIGALVRLTVNCDIEKKAVNGATGVVVGFKTHCKKGGTPRLSTVVVRLDSTGELCNVTRGTLDRSWTFGNVKVERERFPLVLAWAFTAHAVQGATLERVLCDPSDCFSPGMLYVILSRCGSRARMILTRLPSPREFAMPGIV